MVILDFFLRKLIKIRRLNRSYLRIPEIITFDQLRKAVKEATPLYIQLATVYLKKQRL